MDERLEEGYYYPEFDSVEPVEPFKLHQVYTKPGSAKILMCKECDNQHFEIGIDSYYTIARCTKCKREECIHEG